MMKKDYKMETYSSDKTLELREHLYELFKDRPMSDDELLINLGLFMRSSALCKILFINELYKYITEIPGIIVEFGTWWGQNYILYENFRSIYETFNRNRRVIVFDTFAGYTGISNKDVKSDTIKNNAYATSPGYENYLEKLMEYHEKNNVLANLKKHTIIKGNVIDTASSYFNNNPEDIIALAYFDLALYEPTLECMKAIKPHLITGSVILLDEFSSKEYPGETIAFKEVFNISDFDIKKSQFMPDRAIAIKK